VPRANVPAVVLPVSKTQLKQLTKRFRDGGHTAGDRDMLDAVLRCYAVVLQQAHGDVERLCTTLPDTRQMAPRVKTLKTMLEKLQRQPNLHSIGQIRDVAGLRVVVAGTRTDQDDLTDRLALLLADDADPTQGKTVEPIRDPAIALFTSR